MEAAFILLALLVVAGGVLAVLYFLRGWKCQKGKCEQVSFTNALQFWKKGIWDSKQSGCAGCEVCYREVVTPATTPLSNNATNYCIELPKSAETAHAKRNRVSPDPCNRSHLRKQEDCEDEKGCIWAGSNAGSCIALAKEGADAPTTEATNACKAGSKAECEAIQTKCGGDTKCDNCYWKSDMECASGSWGDCGPAFQDGICPARLSGNPIKMSCSDAREDEKPLDSCYTAMRAGMVLGEHREETGDTRKIYCVGERKSPGQKRCATEGAALDGESCPNAKGGSLSANTFDRIACTAR